MKKGATAVAAAGEVANEGRAALPLLPVIFGAVGAVGIATAAALYLKSRKQKSFWRNQPVNAEGPPRETIARRPLLCTNKLRQRIRACGRFGVDAGPIAIVSEAVPKRRGRT